MRYRPVAGARQTSLLLAHFTRVPSISAMEAHMMFKIRSLSRRINDLEASGHKFRREHKVDSTGQRYVRYHYLGQENHGSLTSPLTGNSQHEV